MTLIGPLVVLAIVDSTSIGTLLLPVLFLLRPHGVCVARYLLYLGTIATFYLALGTVLLFGGRAWLGDLSSAAATPVGARILLVVGLAMLIGSFFMGKRDTAGPGRLTRGQDRIMADESGPWGLVGLALVAGVLEAATMLPYLAAIGLLATADLATPTQLALLAAYCLVMVLPALALLAVRLGARSMIEPVLRRIAAWMEKNGADTTAWIVGIAGFLIARSAAGPAGLTALIERLSQG
ncbi:GAP family protein [Demetria terragena]|uniref:GAP family protein n=1 Tax=Demetria terragena TaxID=63959 RepID=UPI00035E42BD|nr:GAP family protein [Demetria terragena]